MRQARGSRSSAGPDRSTAYLPTSNVRTPASVGALAFGLVLAMTVTGMALPGCAGREAESSIDETAPAIRGGTLEVVSPHTVAHAA